MPNKLNENLEDLSAAICDFCQDILEDRPSDVTAQHFCITTEQFLPDLMMKTPNAPDIVLARRLIEFALKGLDNFVLSEIWKLYYLKQEPPKSVALSVRRPVKTIQRKVLEFPKKIAAQLWEKNYEYANPISSWEPMTEEQRKKKFIQERYALTLTQSNVLFQFWLSENVGRDQIRDRLGISPNTMKSHISNIIHKIGATHMNHAVSLVELAYTKTHLSLDEKVVKNISELGT